MRYYIIVKCFGCEWRPKVLIRFITLERWFFTTDFCQFVSGKYILHASCTAKINIHIVI